MLENLGAKKEGGFTIPELLTTLIVLSIAFFAFSTLFLTISHSIERSSDLLLANSTAFAKMQEYENKDFAAIPRGSAPTYEVEDFTATLPTDLIEGVGKVYVEEKSPTLLFVRVEVDYRVGQQNRQIIYPNYIQLSGVGR